MECEVFFEELIWSKCFEIHRFGPDHIAMQELICHVDSEVVESIGQVSVSLSLVEDLLAT